MYIERVVVHGTECMVMQSGELGYAGMVGGIRFVCWFTCVYAE
jgi:hypothetical protein